MSDGRWKDGMCAKEGNNGMLLFFLIFFLLFFDFSRERWNHAGEGGLLGDDTGHYREEMCVPFGLDVSFIFSMKLVAVLAW